MGTRRWRSIAGIVAFAVVAVAAGTFAAASLMVAVGAAPTAYPQDRPANAVLAGVCLVIAGLCLGMAVRLWRAPRGAVVVVVTTARRRKRPVFALMAAMVLSLVLTTLSAFAIVSAVHDHSAGRLSAYVQRDGIPVLAAVTGVRYIPVLTRRGTSYQSEVDVSLPLTVAGTRISVVHDPREITIQPGTLVHVLLDPGRPAYAEFPGQPFTSASAWVGAAGATVYVTALAVFLWARTVLAIRGRGHPFRLRWGSLCAWP